MKSAQASLGRLRRARFVLGRLSHAGAVCFIFRFVFIFRLAEKLECVSLT